MKFFKNFFILLLMCMIVLVGCDRLLLLTPEEFDALVEGEGDGSGGGGETAEWSQVGTTIPQPNIADISLYVNNGTPYVACAIDQAAATCFVFLNEYTGGNWQPYNGGSGNVHGALDGAYNVDLKFYNNNPYVAYIAMTASTEVYVKTFNAAWTDVGTNPMSLADNSCVSLAINHATSMFIIFEDAAMIEVWQYTGAAAWTTMTDPAASGQYFSIAQYAGDPYIAYVTTAPNILECNATWDAVGSITDNAGDLAFCINNTGIKYIAYCNESDSSKLAVRKYSGSSWLDVGSGPVTNNGVSKTCMFVDNNDVYVAFCDNSVGNRVTVKKYNSATSSWVTLGQAGFSGVSPSLLSLHFDTASKIPYVAFYTSSSLTIMKYD